MTPRELRLRQRIDTLRRANTRITKQRDQARTQAARHAFTLDARETAAATQARRQLERPAGCIYCGQGPANGWPRTCHGHRDLPRLDPHYQMRAPHTTPRQEAAA